MCDRQIQSSDSSVQTEDTRTKEDTGQEPSGRGTARGSEQPISESPAGERHMPEMARRRFTDHKCRGRYSCTEPCPHACWHSHRLHRRPILAGRRFLRTILEGSSARGAWRVACEGLNRFLDPRDGHREEAHPRGEKGRGGRYQGESRGRHIGRLHRRWRQHAALLGRLQGPRRCACNNHECAQSPDLALTGRARRRDRCGRCDAGSPTG